MRYVELVIQGIRRFTATQRIPLDQDRVWIAAGTGKGKSTIAGLLRSAFDAPYFRAVHESLVPWRPEQEIARFAATFEGPAGRYRVLGDARSGGLVCARHDPQSDKYQSASQDATGILNILSDDFDLPDPADWRAVYLWTSDGGGGGAAAAATPGFEVEMGGPTDAGEIAHRLEELQAERTLMASMDKIQFEIDGLQDTQFKLEAELEQIGKRTGQLAELDQELERTAPLADIDRKVQKTAQDYNNLTRRHQDRLNQLEGRAEAAEVELAKATERKTWLRDPIFIGVCVATLLGFVVPVALKVYALSLLGFAGALGGIPAMAWIYKKHGDTIATKQKLRDDAVQEYETYRDEQEALFERVDALVREMQVLDAADLVKLFEQRDKLQRKRDELAAAIAEEGLEARGEAARGELDELMGKLGKLQKSVEDASAAQRDAREIDEEITHLEERLQLARSGGAAAVAAASATATVGGEEQSPQERLARLVEAGPRVARRDVMDFTQSISPLVTKIVSAVYPDQFKAVDIDPSGEATYIDALRSEPIEAEQIHQGIHLVTAAAATIATAKLAARERSFPLVWDEPFAALDDATLGRLAQVLAKAAGELQLIVLTGRKALGSALGQPVSIP